MSVIRTWTDWNEINQRREQMSEQANETTQEDADMATVRAVFEKASNAIVDASRLGKLVTEMEVKVNGLVRDIDELRQRNRWLDEQLQYVRKARDEAESKNAELQSQNETQAREITFNAGEINRLRSDLDAMEARWHDASKERDEAMLREMELQDQLKAAQEKLAAISKALGFDKVDAGEVKEVAPQAQETPPQFEHSETTEERERREQQSRDEAGRFGPKVVGFDY